MSGIQVGATVLGLDKVQAALGKLAVMPSDPAVKKGLDEAAKVFVDGGRARLAARLLHHGRNTGNLNRSFTRYVKRRGGGALAGFVRGAMGGNHSHLVDRGTVKRYTRDGRYRGIMPANYFWKQTLDEDSGMAAEAVLDGIREYIYRHT